MYVALITYDLILLFMCILESRGKVLNGELLYTKILEVNLFAFAYRLQTVCRQMQTN